MRKTKLFSLLAALVCATTMWAATEFAYCYDCQRSPAYPTLNQTCRLSGFRNPYVGNGALAGPWKLEFVGYYDPDNDMYHVSNPVDGTCRYYFSDWSTKTEEEQNELKRTIKVYALYQKQDDVWTLAARNSNYGYGVVVADNPSTNTALFISGQGSNGCFLTDVLYSNEDSYNMDVTEDLSHSIPATPAVTGKLTGAFSVSADKQVYFSQGNLQYQASTNTWRFAEHQYDFIGDAAGNNTESGRNTQSDWIDLFGWATSGNSASGTAYQPWQSSTTDSEYGPEITSGQWTYANSDWGINPISNGGNVANSWRTLTQAEWNYILNSRSTDYRFSYAKLNIGVQSYNGLIILPDDWDPSYYALSAESMNQSNHDYISNVISEEDWTNSLEAHGAVFLPVTGMRYNGNGVIGLDDDKIGFYWSSIAAERHEVIEDPEEGTRYIDIVNAAYNLAFNGGYYIRANEVTTRSRGLAVRLVSETAPGGGLTPDPTPSTPAVNGKLTGEFSINSTGGKVNFSSGNLQYLASTDTWRFGENQYDYIGAAPGNNVYTGRATQAQWIDLFCWGTGTNPTYISYNGADFLPEITGEEYEFGTANDWGTAAAEDLGDGWRTLNKAEWLYILEERDNAANLWTKATVDGKAGLLLLPDGWTADGVTLTITGTSGAFTTNELDLDEWATLQNQGAVFLPAAGFNNYRPDVPEYQYVGQAGEYGYYWLATAADDAMGDKRADATMFYDSHIYTFTYRYRCMGASVRLVQDVQAANTRDDVSGIEDAMAALIGTGATDLTIVRDLYKDGFFNTICLPFSLNAAELAASPLAGCQLYSLSDASYAGDRLDLTIAEESTIEAGMPYLIKWTSGSDITSMTFTGVTVTESTGSTVEKGGVKFVGTIGRSTLPHGEADYLFLGANDNLYYSASDDVTSMKGFRAYFIVNSEASTEIPRHAPARLVIAPKMPTAVENVSAKIGESEKRIENGQLFIIKDGIKYNAQGKVVK